MNLINKNIFCILCLFLLQSSLVSAANWYKGTLHVHTGFSTGSGYDGNFFTLGDNCYLETLEALTEGRNVSQLKQNATSYGLSWQSFTDHSYCLNSSEWNNLISECSAQSDDDFLCTADMEFSIHDEGDAGNWRDEYLCAQDFTSPLSYFSGDGSFAGGLKAGHLGAHGISSFISSDPVNVWCPDSPGSQEVTCLS
jgi:hypothetical protein